MSNRPRRAPPPPPSPVASTSKTRSRPTRQSVPKIEPAMEVDDEEEVEEPEEVGLGPSRRSRSTRGRKGGNLQRGTKVKDEGPTESEDVEDDGVKVKPAGRRRASKRVSYREVPIEVEEEEEEEEEEVGPGVPDLGEELAEEEEEEEEEDEEVEETDQSPKSAKKRKASMGTPKDDEGDKDRPYKRETVGSGRGGFSVKGAAAAAARARWEKVRREKAERGDESDGGERRRREKEKGRRENRAALDNVEMDSVVYIKGVEYTIGDDELILPDNPKGETKIDAEGHLLGGREYKLVTFSSPTRRNPNRVYALTIDAARACGYADSLAFLRRCPQALKLACNAEERQMLIDIGRVTGNLKHRMVTMVAMRNIYKIMGARIVKNGKWVTDDYNEEDGLAQCTANGWTPYTLADEEDIIANALQTIGPPGRPSTRMVDELSAPITRQRSAATFSSLQPFYTLGGASTQFGGNGKNPWSDAGWGSKRAKLRGAGLSEVYWMWKMGMDSRRVDEYLRECRQERLKVLQGVDGVRGWVYAAENGLDGSRTTPTTAVPDSKSPNDLEGQVGDGKSFENVMEGMGYLKAPPTMRRVRSQLSQEVHLERDRASPGDTTSAVTPKAMESIEESGEGLTGQGMDFGDIEMGSDNGEGDNLERTRGGKIIVETRDESERSRKDRKRYIGGSWKPGMIYAAYEPHTQIPHIPQHTQPIAAEIERVSTLPFLSQEIVQSGTSIIQPHPNPKKCFKGLATLEYILSSGPAMNSYSHDGSLHFESQGEGDGYDRSGYLDEPDSIPIVVGSAGSDSEFDGRLRLVKEAEEWAKACREKRRGA